MSSIAIGIRDLSSDLKKRFGLKQQQVAHNLDYLIQVGWAVQVVKERDFTTKRGARVSQEQVKYKISDVGINHLEGATVFSKPPTSTRINITNIQGVTVVGDGNVVNAELTDLSAALDAFDELLDETSELTEEQKLDAAADAATIRNQIAKKRPDKEIVARAWEALRVLSSAASLAGALARIGELVAKLIG